MNKAYLDVISGAGYINGEVEIHGVVFFINQSLFIIAKEGFFSYERFQSTLPDALHNSVYKDNTPFNSASVKCVDSDEAIIEELIRRLEEHCVNAVYVWAACFYINFFSHWDKYFTINNVKSVKPIHPARKDNGFEINTQCRTYMIDGLHKFYLNSNHCFTLDTYKLDHVIKTVLNDSYIFKIPECDGLVGLQWHEKAIKEYPEQYVTSCVFEILALERIMELSSSIY